VALSRAAQFTEKAPNKHNVVITEYLWKKPVAMLIKLTRTTASLTCPHFNMCLPCAEKARRYELDRSAKLGERADSNAGAVTHCINMCRGEFNEVMALPEYLVVPLGIGSHELMEKQVAMFRGSNGLVGRFKYPDRGKESSDGSLHALHAMSRSGLTFCLK